MTNPKISVILTCHDRPHMVRRAIDHIINQSFQDFELIIVDDCSKDSLKFEELEFGTLDFKVIRNETNIGANKSRLKGLQISRGEYVCFHDDDDYWMADKLKRQYNFLEKNPQYHLITAYAETKTKVLKFPVRPSVFSLSIHNCIGSFSIPMIRNSKILDAALDNDLDNAQDWHVWRNIRKYHKVATLEEVLVFFDDGAHDRISSVKNIDQYYSSYLKVALKDSPNLIIKLHHQSIANYHLSNNISKTLFWGILTTILRVYVKFRLYIEER